MREIKPRKLEAVLFIVFIIVGYIVYCYIIKPKPAPIKMHIFYTDPVARQTTKRMLR